MAATSKAGRGVSGAAALIGAAGLWLAYAGVRDVPVFEGLRQVLRREKPEPKAVHDPFRPQTLSDYNQIQGPALGTRPGDQGIDRLTGCARAGYPTIRATVPSLTINGWRATGSVPDSDHPRGLALDVMGPNRLQAAQIIATFVRLPGAHYWIWNSEIANIESSANRPAWTRRPYTGPSPHTDHVHLSFYDRCS